MTIHERFRVIKNVDHGGLAPYLPNKLVRGLKKLINS